MSVISLISVFNIYIKSLITITVRSQLLVT